MPGGRPTAWNDETMSKLEEALELGLSRNRAADFAGIARSTLFARIEQETEFSEWVNAREAAGMVRHARRLRDVEEIDPKLAAVVFQSAKFYLSTRGEDAWTEKSAIEHSGDLSVAAAAAEVSCGIAAAMKAEEEADA